MQDKLNAALDVLLNSLVEKETQENQDTLTTVRTIVELKKVQTQQKIQDAVAEIQKQLIASIKESITPEFLAEIAPYLPALIERFVVKR